MLGVRPALRCLLLLQAQPAAIVSPLKGLSMRPFILCVVLACIAVPVVIAQDPFTTGDDLQATVARECAEGCIVFSRQRAADFEQQLELILTARMQQAYDAGVRAQKVACASLI